MKVILGVDELRIGMYVCEFDRPWRETPFLFQGFEIRSQDEIETLRQYCRRVTVLNREAAAPAAGPRERKPVIPAPREASGLRFRSLRTEQEVYKINNHPNARPVYQDVTTFRQEIDKVRNTFDRGYRSAVSAHHVLMKMYEWRNTLFRAELVEKFIQCLGVYPIGSVVELNSGEIGVVAAINRQQRLKPHVMLVYRADQRPYEEMPIANLATRQLPDGRACEIERVLESGAAGIDPAYYLHMAVSL